MRRRHLDSNVLVLVFKNLFSKEIGTWSPGLPSVLDLKFGTEIELFKAKKVYKIVSVLKPPFMEWNETTSMITFLKFLY